MRFTLILISLTCFAATVFCQEKCEDQLQSCGGLVGMCDQATLRTICRKTCNACLSCAECDQKCDKETNTCACHSGYKLMNKTTCVDINECAEPGKTPCPNPDKPICYNTVGTYTCLSEEDNCVQADGFTTYYGQEKTRCCKQTTTSIGLGKCGINVENVKPGKIVGGEPAKAAMWPWMAYLRISGQLCGGALINDRWVLSAAHCFTANLAGDRSPVEITFGMTVVADTSETTRQKRFSKQIIIHESYDYPRYDIALVELNEPVKWSFFVGPICLPNGEEPRVGMKCFATGYGTTAFRGNVTDRLQEVDLPIINTTTCVKRYENDFVTVDGDVMICAGYKEGGKDACQGDSGGPLVCQRCDSCDYYVAGITSFGKGCALPDNYGVYTNVEALEGWIASKISTITVAKKKCVQKEWTNWQTWGQCSKSCEGGRQSRIRFCLNGIAGKDGCFGDALQFQDCNKQNCSAPTPRWSKFSAWSACTATCGTGTTTRVRKCIGGREGDGECTGLALETEDCNTQLCPRWSAWKYNVCNVTCGEGIQTGTRVCLNGDIGEVGCTGKATTTKACNLKPCVKVWSPWTTCSVTCGSGVETRTCLSCTAAPEMETRPCSLKECTRWAEWGDWSECTKSCGRGTQRTRRTCIGGAAGDEGCVGLKARIRKCNTERCPVAFKPWSDWTTCTVTCGGGKRSRTRVCPRAPCDEDEFGSALEQTEDCNKQRCPKWGKWGSWDECTKICGSGTRSSTRECIGGTTCEGESIRTEECNTMACVKWEKWSEWGACSATCGQATSQRTRTCTKIDASKQCVGDATETRPCNGAACPDPCDQSCKSLVVADRSCFTFDITFWGCSSSCCECKDDPSANCDLSVFGVGLGCADFETAYSCKLSCGLCY